MYLTQAERLKCDRELLTAWLMAVHHITKETAEALIDCGDKVCTS